MSRVGPKGAQGIGIVKSPFGPCKPPQLLLADDNKAFYLSRPVIVIYQSRHENTYPTVFSFHGSIDKNHFVVGVEIFFCYLNSRYVFLKRVVYVIYQLVGYLVRKQWLLFLKHYQIWPSFFLFVMADKSIFELIKKKVTFLCVK